MAPSCLLRLQLRPRHKRIFTPLIAPALQNILRANAAFPCWSCKAAGRFLSIMPMADRHAEDGQSSAEQKVFGGSRRSLRHAMDCLSSTIPFPTRSRNGRVIRANRGSPYGSCSTRPTALKELRVFNALRSAIAMPRQFDYRPLLNRDRLLFMGQVIYKSFLSCSAGG